MGEYSPYLLFYFFVICRDFAVFLRVYDLISTARNSR